MHKHAVLSFAVLAEDLLGRFMYISQMGLLILPTYMHSYLVGLEIFCHFLPFTHIDFYETTCIEDFRRPASRSRIEQKFISGCAGPLADSHEIKGFL